MKETTGSHDHASCIAVLSLVREVKYMKVISNKLMNTIPFIGQPCSQGLCAQWERRLLRNPAMNVRALISQQSGSIRGTLR